jgi:hypothetical protein
MVLESRMRCVACGSIDPSMYDARVLCCEPSFPVERHHPLVGWDWIWLSPESIMYWTPSGGRPL